LTRINSYNDLRIKLPRQQITARTDIGDLLKIKLKSIPEKEIIIGFSKAINRASNKIAIDLREALNNAMRSQMWPTNSGIADIYDSGALLESGEVTVARNGVIISYSSPYAALVHYGGYINPYGRTNEKVYLPARPWVEAVLNGMGMIEPFDFARYYEEEIFNEFS